MSTTPKYQEIFDALVPKISEMFEVDASAITAETHLFTDLGLDSIDAIDLAVQLQDYTGQRIQEDSLRALRTVDDVVRLVLELSAEKSA